MKDINQAIELIASKLGTTVQYLWSVLIRQAKLEAIEDLIGTVIILVSFYALYRLCKWLFKKANDESYSDIPYDGLAALCITLSVIWGIIGVIIIILSICDAMNALFNPEYWALHEIIKNL